MPETGLLSTLFSSAVAVYEVSADEPLDTLFPSEAAHVARAVAKRQREFSAGRHCARRALAALGGPSTAVGVGPDRAPCWPPGFVGSITHTGGLDDGYAAAAVARASDVESVGLDAEQRTPLGDELFRHVLTRSESEYLATLPESERGVVAKLCFSAKEAFYKCQYPLTRQFLGFHDVELEVDLAYGRFRALPTRQIGRFARGAAFEGRFAIGAKLLLSGIQLQAPQAHGAQET